MTDNRGGEPFTHTLSLAEVNRVEQSRHSASERLYFLSFFQSFKVNISQTYQCPKVSLFTFSSAKIICKYDV